MKQKHWIIAGVAILIVGVLGVSVARASQGSFWDLLATKAGETLGQILGNSVQKPTTESTDFLGASGDVNRTAFVKSVSITSGGFTTTSVQNATGVTTTIDRVIFYSQGNGSPATTSIHMAISSDGVNATTDLGVSTTLSGGAGYSWATTSTFPTVSLRQLPPNQYVICYTNSVVVSTTQGFCAVEYFKP